jgi:Carboxypeptidase regulatory-like domain
MKPVRVGLLLATVLLMAVALGLPASSTAQEARGTITGTVVDGSKAVVPGASVTVTNIAMGTDVAVVTNEQGFFQAPYLIPGTYRISVELTGFKKLVREGLEVRVGDRLALELALEVGGASEEVTVSAATPLLETATGSVGQVVDARRVAELPIPHGDAFALIGLASGTSFLRSARLDRPFEPTHIVGYTMNGTRANRSDLTIDGIPSTATANAGEVTATYVPPQGLVQEFRVQTATFDASLGNTEGGVTNLVLKSGTNQFHGEAYYVKTPRSMFANDYFANANNIPLTDFSYTRWAASAFGPIIRNKTFFTYGYEAIPEARPRNNGTPSVPTEKMRNGDFSELLALGPQYQLYNPFTARSAAGGRVQRDPFPGNIIPRELMNPVALNVLDYIARPRTAGAADGSGNFQRPEMKEETEYGSHTVRVDHNLTQNQRMYGRVSWYDRNSNYNNYFDNLSTGQWFRFVSRQVAIDHVWTVNSTTVLNVRYGFDRFTRGDQGNPANHGFDLTELGFPASYANAIPADIRKFPRFDITGFQGTGVAGEDRPIENQTFIATANKVVGAHSFKTGVEYRRYQETSIQTPPTMTGQFNFGDTWVRGPLDNSPVPPRGGSVAAFLLGLPDNSSFVQRAPGYEESSSTTGLYLQDDWRVGSRLTLNLGVRWEFEAPMVESQNRSARGFDTATSQAFEAQARAAYAASQATNPTPEVPAAQFNVKGGLTFAGVNGQPEGLYSTPKDNIMPRLGFAYKMDERTVVRGGYGMYYGFLGQRRGDVVQIGYSASTPMTVSTNNGLTFVETLSNPFQGGILEPRGSADGIATFLGQNITYFDPNPKSPRNQRWQIGVQRELGGVWVGEARYVGNYGSQLETARNINALPNGFLSTSPVRDQVRNDYLTAQVPNPFVGLMPASAPAGFRGATIGRQQLMRPYPHFGDINTTTNEGESWYNALQLTLERRLSRGYTFNVAYTYSRFEEASTFLNAGDAEPTRMISDMDAPHRVAISGIWELPFGQGRRYGTNLNPVANAIVGGWQISGIYQFQTGAPVGNFGNYILIGSEDDIALPGSDRTLERWFNVDAFNRVSAQQLVSNVRTLPMRFSSVRAHDVNNVDLSLIKNTAIKTATFQFRLEALNAFNHPLFPAPGVGTVTATTFGQVVTSTQANYARRVQAMLKVLF